MKKNAMDLSGLLALVLFAVFAVCVLTVLLTGADTYSRLTQRDRESYQSRTVAQYLATRLRQGDEEGGIWVGDFSSAQPSEQGDTLFLSQDIDGVTYDTRVYVYEGSLRELFAQRGEDFSPSDGEEILPAEDLEITCSDGLFTLTVTQEDGERTTLSLYSRSGEVTP